jgi:Cation transport protein
MGQGKSVITRVVVISTAVLMVVLLLRATDSPGQTFRHALFQAVSIVTSTGFATADVEQWPVASQYVLLLLMFFGGCAASTGGAIKHIRITLLIKLPTGYYTAILGYRRRQSSSWRYACSWGILRSLHYSCSVCRAAGNSKGWESPA